MTKVGSIIKRWGNEPLGKLIAKKFYAWLHPPLEYPWSEELNDEVRQADSHAVCPHCFTPQDGTEWFCSECGAATGPYNNIMPYINIFSVGEGARACVGGKLKRSPFNALCLILFGLAEYAVFAPFFWFRMYRNWRCQKTAGSAPSND